MASSPKILVAVLIASFALLAVSQRPTGRPRPSGPPPTGRPHGHGPGHGPCGPPHPHGPPRCDKPEDDDSAPKHDDDDKHGPPHHGPHGPHRRGPPPPGPLGPVFIIYCNLTTEEQQSLNKIVESNFNATKKELKSQLDIFVEGLSTELKDAVTAEKQHFEEMRKNITEKIQKLSADAQELSSEIEKIISDDSLTFPEEHKKLHDLVEKADKKVVKEFLDAHIPIPGFCPPPPHHKGGDKKHGGDKRRKH